MEGGGWRYGGGEVDGPIFDIFGREKNWWMRRLLLEPWDRGFWSEGIVLCELANREGESGFL